MTINIASETLTSCSQKLTITKKPDYAKFGQKYAEPQTQKR